jgi:cutinase
VENVIYAQQRGTSPEAIKQGIDVFNKAATKCPESKIVFSGYSQGGALVTAAVGDLQADVKAKVIGGILYGSTKAQQLSEYRLRCHRATC